MDVGPLELLSKFKFNFKSFWRASSKFFFEKERNERARALETKAKLLAATFVCLLGSFTSPYTYHTRALDCPEHCSVCSSCFINKKGLPGHIARWQSQMDTYSIIRRLATATVCSRPWANCATLLIGLIMRAMDVRLPLGCDRFHLQKRLFVPWQVSKNILHHSYSPTTFLFFFPKGIHTRVGTCKRVRFPNTNTRTVKHTFPATYFLEPTISIMCHYCRCCFIILTRSPWMAPRVKGNVHFSTKNQ